MKRLLKGPTKKFMLLWQRIVKKDLYFRHRINFETVLKQQKASTLFQAPKHVLS